LKSDYFYFEKKIAEIDRMLSISSSRIQTGAC
jgi:hypothetical protein